MTQAKVSFFFISDWDQLEVSKWGSVRGITEADRIVESQRTFEPEGPGVDLQQHQVPSMMLAHSRCSINDRGLKMISSGTKLKGPAWGTSAVRFPREH